MKTCPVCQSAFPDEIESCTRDGSKLFVEFRKERECPYCAEPILRKARVCKHCGRDVEPLAGASVAAQAPQPATPERSVETPTAHAKASEPVGAASRPPAAAREPQLQIVSIGPSHVQGVPEFLQAAVFGLVLLAVVGGGIWHFSQPRPEPEPAPSVTSPSAQHPAQTSTTTPCQGYDPPIADWELEAVCRGMNDSGVRCDDPHDPSLCEMAKVARTARLAGFR